MSTLILTLLPKPRREVIYVHPDVLISQCCQIMAQNNIGALMVGDDNNLIGLLSERDIVRRCLCQGLDVNKATAGDIAFADVAILSPQDRIENAMEKMITERRRHVLVEEEDGLFSIISIGDILYYLLEEKNLVIEQLEHYIYS